MSIGCDDFVIKPFKEEDIVEKLQKHLDVKFVYANAEILTEKSNLKSAKLKLRPADFNALPKATVVRFKASVATLEMDTVLAVVEEIKEQDQPLADALKQLVDGYRFDKLQKLLEES